MAREQLLAWPPFVAALAVAFAAGFVFARLCQGRTMTFTLPRPWAHVRRGGSRLTHARHVEAEDGITVAAVYLALFLLWMVVALFVWRMVR